MDEEGEEEEEEGDREKDCDQTWCESFQQEEVMTRACIDNKMNVERCEIRANDNFSSKEPRSHVNTFGNSVQLSSQAGFDVDNDEGETTGITNTWLQLRTVNLPLPPGHVSELCSRSISSSSLGPEMFFTSPES